MVFVLFQADQELKRGEWMMTSYSSPGVQEKLEDEERDWGLDGGLILYPIFQSILQYPAWPCDLETWKILTSPRVPTAAKSTDLERSASGSVARKQKDDEEHVEDAMCSAREFQASGLEHVLQGQGVVLA